MKPKLNLMQRFRLLRLAAAAPRLAEEANRMAAQAKDLEGTTCGYCKGWKSWKDLTDESTQTQRRPLICDKCLRRREYAVANGWHDWPNRL